MTKQIQYYRKNVYGNELLYLIIHKPEDVEARTIYSITGKKTTTYSEMQLFKRLGVEFTEVLQPRNI